MCDVEWVAPDIQVPNVGASTMGRLKVVLHQTLPRRVVSDRDKSRWQIRMQITANTVGYQLDAYLAATHTWKGPAVKMGEHIDNRWDAFRFLLPKWMRRGRIRMRPIMVPTQIIYEHLGG